MPKIEGDTMAENPEEMSDFEELDDFADLDDFDDLDDFGDFDDFDDEDEQDAGDGQVAAEASSPDDSDDSAKAEESSDSAKAEESSESVKAEKPDESSSASPSSGKNGSSGGASRTASPPPSPVSKLAARLLKQVGLEEIPPIEDILPQASGKKMVIEDVAIFTEEPGDDVLAAIQALCPVKNTVNLSAAVESARVKKVAKEILTDGKLFYLPDVAEIEEDGTVQVISGRHRLVALAILYGTKIKVPMSFREMDQNAARAAVVRANETRTTRARERAEYAVVQAVQGDLNTEVQEQYEAAVRNKTTMKRFCTFHIVERGEFGGIRFPVGDRRSDGALTTYAGLEGFWSNGVGWYKSMSFDEFSDAIKTAAEFINSYVESAQEMEGFDSRQHLSSQVLKAIGSYYSSLVDASQDPMGQVSKVATAIVGLGEIGRVKQDEIKAKLRRAIQELG